MARVEIHLVSNPKVARSKPFVAEVDLESGNLKFMRAVIPHYSKGVLIRGEYELEPGRFYIIRSDESSHRHSVQVYRLSFFDGNELKEIATIYKTDGNLAFRPEELKDIYAKIKTSGQNNAIVNTLIEYAKLHKARNSIDVEQIVKNEVLAFVAELEKKYGVKINISIEVVRK